MRVRDLVNGLVSYESSVSSLMCSSNLQDVQNVFWSLFRNYLNKSMVGRYAVYNPFTMFHC